MINIFRFLTLTALLIVQFMLIPRLSLGMFEPDLLLVFTVLIGLFHGMETGCIVGFAAGLLSDVNTGILLGAKALSWTQVGFAAALAREKLVFDNYLSQSLLVVLGCLLAGVFQVFFYGMSIHDASLNNIIFHFTIQALITAALSYPLVRLLRWLRWAPVRQQE